MTRTKLVFLLFIIIALGFLGAFLSGFYLKAYFSAKNNDFPILNQAYQILVNHTYSPLPEPTNLEYGMIRGMLESSADPYATFQEPVQHELEANNLQGSFGGIGVEFNYDSEGNFLLFPIGNGPAAKAGINKGDRLLQVDQLIVNTETSLDQIKAAVRGPIGENVHILIYRSPSEPVLEFDINREVIHLPSVTWRIFPDDATIGIMKINIIADSTPQEILDAVGQLQLEGAEEFVIDLRDNGGGLLTAGVDIARLFLKDGIIIQQQYRGDNVETFRTVKPGVLSDIPLVILINDKTASAAEIIAGALQAHNRAILIGSNSFGKDSIQLIFDLDDGSSIHITAAKWWLPNIDYPISEGGLKPDIEISQGENLVDVILDAAVEYYRNN
jgi:carboxyl-terminal processing protease